MYKKIQAFILRGVFVVAFSVVLSSCGGDGDGEIGTADGEVDTGEDEAGTGGGEAFSGYVALRAVVSDDQISGFSNEVEVDTASGSTSMTFQEPTHQMDGECLTAPINAYQVHSGTESRNYNEDPIILARDSTMLDCSAVDSNECGDVVKCTATVEF